MRQDEKPHRSDRWHSLRQIVGMTVCVCLASFIGIFYFYYHASTLAILTDAEERYIQEKYDVVQAAIEDTVRSNYELAVGLGYWSETVRFVTGENDGYFRDNWIAANLMHTYALDYAVFYDRMGNIVHSEWQGKDGSAPENLSSALGLLAEDIVSGNKRVPLKNVDAVHSKQGILFAGDQPYLLAAVPVMIPGQDTEAHGALVVGYVLDEAFLRSCTHYTHNKFVISPIEVENLVVMLTVERFGDHELVVQNTIDDINGMPLRFELHESREAFNGRTQQLNQTGYIFLGFFGLFGLVLYVVLSRRVVRPIEQLSEDIGSLVASGRIDTARYASLLELSNLSEAVNEMIDEQAKSNISIEVFQSILNGMDAYIYVSDPDTDEILFLNDRMMKHFGLDESSVGQICWQVLQSGFTERCSFCPNFHLQDHPSSVVSWQEHNTVTERFYRNTDTFIAWSDQKLVHLQHSVDITDLKRSEESLLRYSAIVKSSPSFICYVDDSNQFVYINPGAEMHTGYSYEELMGSRIDMLFDDDQQAVFNEEIIPHILQEGMHLFEMPMTRKDGEVRIMSFSAFLLEDERNGFGIIASDMTEMIKLEQELIAARDAAEQSNFAKSTFLSRMSHEMRTPMNAIIGMANIARSTDDPERKEHCLDRIGDASAHLLGVINDILDMSKIEANKLELFQEDFKVEHMLQRVCNVISFRVNEKGQNFLVHIDKDLPVGIISDEQRLAQVLTNLLSNAVKFTPERGTITLSARLLEETPDGLCTLEFSVSDTGIGISDEQKSRLFTSFEQADGSISRRFGGTGLGLAISKSIVNLMDGTIWVDSVPGEGSTFIFHMKAKRGSNVDEALYLDVEWKNLRVMIVDDSADICEYFQNVAERGGFVCESATDAYEACALLDAQGSDAFDIIFVDWKLPGMNGMELTRRMKTDYASKAIIVMISSAEWADIEHEANEVGVDRFIAKPLFSSQIIDCITGCLGVPRSNPTRSQFDSLQGRFAGKCVLLTEDIEINREIVISMLGETGISFEVAVNGIEACEVFAEQAARIDLIFMDMHMPEMDGLEATRRIRAMDDIPESRTVPIIAMTANVFREDIDKCIEAGMNAHIGKPIDMDEVVAILERYLGNS